VTWKRTERPEFADHCRRICERYGAVYEDFDVVRDAIEENLETDPIEGSVPVIEGNPEVRRFTFEEHPPHWDLPALVVVLEVSVEERSFTLLEVWTEEELDEQADV
jgi:hypothetical protein